MVRRYHQQRVVLHLDDLMRLMAGRDSIGRDGVQHRITAITIRHTITAADA